MAAAFIIKGDDGLEYGPVELSELREWVREKRAGLGTSVRHDEPEAIWQPWQYYPELVALLAESQARDTVAVAPLARRLIAFLIDLFLINILFVLIFYGILLPLYPAIFAPWFAASQAMLVSGQLTSFHLPARAESLLELLTFTLFLLYFAGYHFAHGRTPGKSILRLRVVDRHGEKPTTTRALIRALVLCLSGYLFVPLLFIFFHPQRRALHDLAAGTYVVEL